MKKVLSLVLAVVMMAAMFAFAASAMVGEGYHNYGEIANVERKSIRLDAVKEAAYDAATPIAINNPAVKDFATGETHPWYPRENGEAPARPWKESSNTMEVSGVPPRAFIPIRKHSGSGFDLEKSSPVSTLSTS